MLKNWLRGIVRDVIVGELADERKKVMDEAAGILHDVTYRLSVLQDNVSGNGQRITSANLNLAMPMLDGYVFEDNKPVAGSVQWTDVNIVYKGTTYTITNGSTALKYIWWDFSATDKTKLQTSDTKPVLDLDDILIGVNDAGKFSLTMAPGKMTPGGALLDGSIGQNELGPKAVTGEKIADLAVNSGQLAAGAVGPGKLGSGAINNSNLFSGKVINGANMTDGAVGTLQLGTGAVGPGKIGAGAINASNLFSTGVVDSGAIGTGAVGPGKLGTGAINNSNLFSGKVINGANMADGAVGSLQLGSGAVGPGKIGSGAINNSNLFTSGVVTDTAIGAGAVKEDKLNVATHFLF